VFLGGGALANCDAGRRGCFAGGRHAGASGCTTAAIFCGLAMSSSCPARRRFAASNGSGREPRAARAPLARPHDAARPRPCRSRSRRRNNRVLFTSVHSSAHDEPLARRDLAMHRYAELEGLAAVREHRPACCRSGNHAPQTRALIGVSARVPSPALLWGASPTALRGVVFGVRS
jgi:hypothetical protein